MSERSVGLPLPRRVLQRPEQRPVNVLAVAGGLEVIVDALQGQRVGRHVPHFGALSENAQVGHALAALEVAHAQAAQFFTPQAMVKKRRENRPVPFALERVFRRGVQQRPGLAVARAPASCPRSAPLWGA
jgi:hypothetical protein